MNILFYLSLSRIRLGVAVTVEHVTRRKDEGGMERRGEPRHGRGAARLLARAREGE
jgi:hypothetical protein